MSEQGEIIENESGERIVEVTQFVDYFNIALYSNGKLLNDDEVFEAAINHIRRKMKVYSYINPINLTQTVKIVIRRN